MQKLSAGKRVAMVVGTLAAAAGIGLAAAPAASAATAQNTGLHKVCAQSLTLHQTNGDYTIVNGAAFNIDHFADGYGHAWGTVVQNGRYGWVYNGYFC